MSSSRASVIAGALLAAAALDLAAQSSTLKPGARIRVAAERTYTGTLIGLDTTHLRLQPQGRADTVVVPTGAVTKLELSTGQKSAAGRGALIGALVGGGLGLLLGTAAASESCDPNKWCIDYGGEAVAAGVVLLGGVGALTGAFIGALSRTDRWEPVPPGGVELGATSGRRGGIGIGVSVAF